MFNRRLNVSSSVNKIFIKALAISCGSVKLLPLSKILDGLTLDNFFKEIRFFIPFCVPFYVI